MLVAIAAENDDYDVAVYEALLKLVLGSDVEAWRTHDMQFRGVGSVMTLGRTFLERAAARGLGYALLAVDNDGGLRRHPEHNSSHVGAVEVADRDGCRWCRLARVAPDEWTAGAKRHCVVVPVQTIETWLLVARGDAFSNPTPEMNLHRRALKKQLLGPFKPEAGGRVRIGLAALATIGALVRLRERPSFQLFEAQLGAWRS